MLWTLMILEAQADIQGVSSIPLALQILSPRPAGFGTDPDYAIAVGNSQPDRPPSLPHVSLHASI